MDEAIAVREMGWWESWLLVGAANVGGRWEGMPQAGNWGEFVPRLDCSLTTALHCTALQLRLPAFCSSCRASNWRNKASALRSEEDQPVRTVELGGI